jgi:Tfp pilus assembly protein PilV
MRNLVVAIATLVIVTGLTAAAEAQMGTNQSGMQHSRMRGGMSGKQMMSHKRMKMNGMTHEKMRGAKMISKNM